MKLFQEYIIHAEYIFDIRPANVSSAFQEFLHNH